MNAASTILEMAKLMDDPNDAFFGFMMGWTVG